MGKSGWAHGRSHTKSHFYRVRPGGNGGPAMAHSDCGQQCPSHSLVWVDTGEHCEKCDGRGGGTTRRRTSL